jgi:pyridoxamine 5'-phosphate oxidase-like protein
VASWGSVRAAAPDLAAAVQAAFEAHKHKTLATLRRDGSPRLSGTEATFTDSTIWFGMMAGSRKVADVRRDPRVALHSAMADETMPLGDAKLSGRALEVTNLDRFRQLTGRDDAPRIDFTMFELDLTGVAITRLGGDPPDHLVIESWTPERGYQHLERR